MSAIMIQRTCGSVFGQRKAVRAACMGLASTALPGTRPRGDADLFQGMQRWVDRCNTGSTGGLIPVKVADKVVGFVAPGSAEHLVSRFGASPGPREPEI